MKIVLNQASKRYNQNWIFKSISTTFSSGSHYAITGPNGSGKSTLLQTLAGNVKLSSGTLDWQTNKDSEDSYKIHEHIAMVAPYMELIEEMTADELLNFHFVFKPRKDNIENDEILNAVGLADAAQKQIQYFSSGMKQRLKIAQAFFSDTPTLLLDEPTSNLDAQGIYMYQNLLQGHTAGRLIVICSNDEEEIKTCTERIFLPDYKK